MAATTEIYHLSKQSEKAFLCILDIPQASSFIVIEVLYQRFAQWASYLGVFARESMSLDSRLMYSDSLRNLVLQLLAIANKNLDRVMKLEQEQFDVPWRAPSSSMVDQMKEQSGDGASPGSTPLIESLHALEAAVDGLHRLSVAIRQSSSTGLAQRITSFIEKNDGGMVENLVLLLLKNKFIDRVKETGGEGAPLSLCKQLAVSISFRYFGLLYRRSHQKKLETKREETPPAIDFKQAIPSPSQRLNPAPRPRGPAPTPIAPGINQLMDENSESAPTLPDSKKALRKYASSRQSTTVGVSLVSVQLRDVKYPEPPKAKSPAGVVVCAYCTHVLKDSILKDKKLWERHVNDDLQLYACISEECLEPPQLFARFEEWAKHMEEHSSRWAEEIHKPLRWYCDTDHAELFFDHEDDFDQHVKDAHPDYDTESEVAELKEWCEIRRMRPPYTCPICNCLPQEIAVIAPWLVQDPSPKSVMEPSPRPSAQIGHDRDADFRRKLSHHVASHLKQLGFMSITYLDDEEDGSLVSRSASAGADEDRLPPSEWTDTLDPDFDDYAIPPAPEPLDEQIFELDWRRVKDFSLSLSHDYEMDDLNRAFDVADMAVDATPQDFAAKFQQNPPPRHQTHLDDRDKQYQKGPRKTNPRDDKGRIEHIECDLPTFVGEGSQQDQSEEPPLVVFAKDGKRPWINKYGFEYKFRPADEVTTIHPTTKAQMGPYCISEAKDGKYSLCDREGRPLQDGRLFEESVLTLYDPFAS